MDEVRLEPDPYTDAEGETIPSLVGRAYREGYDERLPELG